MTPYQPSLYEIDRYVKDMPAPVKTAALRRLLPKVTVYVTPSPPTTGTSPARATRPPEERPT